MKQIFGRASAGGTSGGTKDKASDAAVSFFLFPYWRFE